MFLLTILIACVAGAAEVAPSAPMQEPLAGQESPSPLSVLSITPVEGEPGSTVIISGTGFTENTAVLLATQELSATIIGDRQLSFEIPDLPAGLYALFLKRGDGTVSRSFGFTLLPKRPIAIDLSPDTVYSCASGREREVVVSGHNFREGSQVLFDGAGIRGRYLSPESVSFVVPQVYGGLHQVQVRNPDGSMSGVLGLMIDAKPEITSVTSGEEYVNYYNLNIDGRNFQQGSTLVVMEERSLDLVAPQLAVDVKRLQSGGGAIGVERDRVVYLNCNRFIYQRYPYSTVPKNFKVQVLNPDGSESAVVSVSAP
jgi:IPT/TIG domain-containing protein